MSSLISWLSGLCVVVVNWFRDMERRHALKEDLYAMDDRLLDDIGLRREDIVGLLKGTLPLNTAGARAAKPAVPAACPWCGRPLAAACHRR